MMKPKRLLIVLCVTTLLAGVPNALAADFPISNAVTQTTCMAARSGGITDTTIAVPYAAHASFALAASEAQASPLPSPLIGDEPVDSGGASISTGAIIAVTLAVLLIVALVVIRLWKRRPPGRSGQDTP